MEVNAHYIYLGQARYMFGKPESLQRVAARQRRERRVNACPSMFDGLPLAVPGDQLVEVAHGMVIDYALGPIAETCERLNAVEILLCRTVKTFSPTKTSSN